jgi:hypothetical protein
VAIPGASSLAEVADKREKIKFFPDEIAGVLCRLNNSAEHLLRVPAENHLTQHVHSYQQTRNGTILRSHIGSIEDGRDW